MVDWIEVWAGLIETADNLGVSRYALGERLYGKEGIKRIYQKKNRACRCMCEDLLTAIKEEMKSKKLLKDKTPEEKKEVRKLLKDDEKLISSEEVVKIQPKETTEDTIKAAINEVKAMQIQPLIEEVPEAEVCEEEAKVETVNVYDFCYGILPESVAPSIVESDEDLPRFDAEEETSLFTRVDKNSFLLEDYFYRMQYPFKIINGRNEVDAGDHILLYIKANGEMKPYILSVDQFKEFVSTGKVDYWFSARLPKEVWDKTSKETYGEEG